MKDWNPDLYLKFEKQRSQPAKDLINSINKQDIHTILDIGCGPGNSTELLSNKWQNSKIIGIDSSQNMIDKAKKRVENAEFFIMDANQDLSSLGSFDVIFSNAALQWMPNHTELLTKLYTMLNNKGVIAVQIPNVTDMLITKAIDDTITSDKWQNSFTTFSKFNLNDMGFYYNISSSLSSEFYLWTTHYYHVLNSHMDILNWYKSTGLKPYLDQLDDVMKSDFEDDMLIAIKEYYCLQKDGKVLFPFIRQFFTIYKN